MGHDAGRRRACAALALARAALPRPALSCASGVYHHRGPAQFGSADRVLRHHGGHARGERRAERQAAADLEAQYPHRCRGASTSTLHAIGRASRSTEYLRHAQPDARDGLRPDATTDARWCTPRSCSRASIRRGCSARRGSSARYTPSRPAATATSRDCHHPNTPQLDKLKADPRGWRREAAALASPPALAAAAAARTRALRRRESVRPLPLTRQQQRRRTTRCSCTRATTRSGWRACTRRRQPQPPRRQNNWTPCSSFAEMSPTRRSGSVGIDYEKVRGRALGRAPNCHSDRPAAPTPPLPPSCLPCADLRAVARRGCRASCVRCRPCWLARRAASLPWAPWCSAKMVWGAHRASERASDRTITRFQSSARSPGIDIRRPGPTGSA